MAVSSRGTRVFDHHERLKQIYSFVYALRSESKWEGPFLSTSSLQKNKYLCTEGSLSAG